MTVADRLLCSMRSQPGQTEAQLAQALFGTHAVQARINFTCRLLEILNLVERRGAGRRSDPYRYHLHLSMPEKPGDQQGPARERV